MRSKKSYSLITVKMGAMMGGSVGLIIGFIFGATNIIRFGPGPNGMLRTLGQYMIGSSATFGFFMGIGSTIRTEGSPMAVDAWARAQRRPLVDCERDNSEHATVGPSRPSRASRRNEGICTL
ncbi:hypothetical protein BT93_L4465 [Corymbia citriodora subsp. variegata]|uniref:Reactive oxygen species modulator 1 n=1 Tax=Corymbia citriodora subsp. variegata TaxID=360336 RepID=A0A8T0CJW4_CORYI|nr:hypothetical protein BT93_L4465 [Corymbia citriodora subsp. variegata]